jgi:hypothetical protein
MRVLDLGAGPGTASLALLLQLLDLTLKPGEQLPPIEMDWYDLNRGVLEDGKALAELLATSFPKLRGKLTVRVHARTWWEAVAPAETSLVLLGNVLNEASNFLPKRRHEGPEGSPLDSEEAETSGPNAASFARGVPKAASFDRGGPGEDEILPGEARAARLAPPLRALVELSRRARGGGVLIVEPAFRKPSQTVSQLRDYLLMTEAIPSDVTSIWGPCPHAQACPLATGRDWCHFSIPAEIPGQWFKAFSRGLGSERHWVKFSYLWLSSPDARAPRPEPGLRLVVSDPIATSAGDRVVLLCEPSSPARLSIPRNLELLRGDWIDPTRIRAVRPGPGPKPAIGRAGGRSGQKPSAGPVSRRKRPRR